MVKEEELKEGKQVLYIGESSQSIMERSREHWKVYKGSKEESHMLKHQQLEHDGEEADFVMKVTGIFKSAPERQVTEVVRIRRSGELKLSLIQQAQNLCKGA